MKKIILFSLLLCLFGACEKDYEEVLPPLPLEGESGDPRFNMVFDNQFAVDFDLHVITPLGEHINFITRASASGGTLDVDCICVCPDENIFFPLDGSAPKGTYQYWVNFFQACEPDASANFTLRVLERNNIITVQEGTLTYEGENSPIWEYVND